MNDPNKVVGWTNLVKYVGRCDHVIKKLIEYWDFPKPERVPKGRNYSVVWDKKAIDAWLLVNKLPKSSKKEDLQDLDVGYSTEEYNTDYE